jgi:Protein of unknown function (DUF2848)
MSEATTNGSATRLVFGVEEGQRTRSINARIQNLVIAGWTGRDAAAVEAHIAELEKIGVKRPKTAPIFYRVAAAQLTGDGEIQVAGEDSSGEVEPVVVSLPDGLYVTVGSDHTDRKVETIGVTISKQLCAKPVAPSLWRFDEVAAHWDEILIRSHAVIEGKRRLYQEGPVARMRDPRELMATYLGRASGILPAGTLMFCGTLAVKGEMAPASRFEIEMEDPVLKRRISYGYDVKTLPVEG